MKIKNDLNFKNVTNALKNDLDEDQILEILNIERENDFEGFAKAKKANQGNWKNIFEMVKVNPDLNVDHITEALKNGLYEDEIAKIVAEGFNLQNVDSNAIFEAKKANRGNFLKLFEMMKIKNDLNFKIVTNALKDGLDEDEILEILNMNRYVNFEGFAKAKKANKGNWKNIFEMLKANPDLKVDNITDALKNGLNEDEITKILAEGFNLQNVDSRAIFEAKKANRGNFQNLLQMMKIKNDLDFKIVTNALKDGIDENEIIKHFILIQISTWEK